MCTTTLFALFLILGVAHCARIGPNWQVSHADIHIAYHLCTNSSDEGHLCLMYPDNCVVTKNCKQLTVMTRYEHGLQVLNHEKYIRALNSDISPKVNAALVGIFMFGRYNQSRADQSTSVLVSNTTGSSGGDLLLCTQSRRVDNQPKIIASSWKVSPELKVTDRWMTTVATTEMNLPLDQQAFYACSFGFWHSDLDNDHSADKFNIQNAKVVVQGFTNFPDYILSSQVQVVERYATRSNIIIGDQSYVYSASSLVQVNILLILATALFYKMF